MLNHVTLQGHLGGPAEIKPIDGGGKVARMSVATRRAWQDDQGEWQDRTAWVRVVTFREGLIDRVIAEKAVKGAPVLLTGELRSNQYDDKDGNRHYVLEVHIALKHDLQFLPRIPKDDAPAAASGAAGPDMSDPGASDSPAESAGAPVTAAGG